MVNDAQVIIEVNRETEEFDNRISSIDDLMYNIAKTVFLEVGITSSYASITISVLLSIDSHVKSLNNDFRSKDYATNILSFPSGAYEMTKEGDLYLGDLALAYETIDKESVADNKNFKDHFCHLLIHGILHLLGYDHIEDSEAEIMEDLEVKILSKFSIKNPYSV